MSDDGSGVQKMTNKLRINETTSKSMHDEEITRALDAIDGSGSETERAALERLKKEHGEILIQIFLDHFKQTKKWARRAAFLYYSTPYSKHNAYAVRLGEQGLKDKSKIVRYRACKLLAWSLSKKSLNKLQEALDNERDHQTFSHIKAAIDAIASQNSDYFVDRNHSGIITMNVS